MRVGGVLGVLPTPTSLLHQPHMDHVPSLLRPSALDVRCNLLPASSRSSYSTFLGDHIACPQGELYFLLGMLLLYYKIIAPCVPSGDWLGRVKLRVYLSDSFVIVILFSQLQLPGGKETKSFWRT